MSTPEVISNQLIILMPVYNDWDALGRLLPALAHELSANNLRAAILLVDDGSTVPPPKNLGDENYSASKSLLWTATVKMIRMTFPAWVESALPMKSKKLFLLCESGGRRI